MRFDQQHRHDSIVAIRTVKCCGCAPTVLRRQPMCHWSCGSLVDSAECSLAPLEWVVAAEARRVVPTYCGSLLVCYRLMRLAFHHFQRLAVLEGVATAVPCHAMEFQVRTCPPKTFVLVRSVCHKDFANCRWTHRNSVAHIRRVGNAVVPGHSARDRRPPRPDSCDAVQLNRVAVDVYHIARPCCCTPSPRYS